MAKTTKQLNAILDYEEGEVEHINGVWPSFLGIRVSLQLYGVWLHPLGGDSPTI